MQERELLRTREFVRSFLRFLDDSNNINHPVLVSPFPATTIDPILVSIMFIERSGEPSDYINVIRYLLNNGAPVTVDSMLEAMIYPDIFNLLISNFNGVENWREFIEYASDFLFLDHTLPFETLVIIATHHIPINFEMVGLAWDEIIEMNYLNYTYTPIDVYTLFVLNNPVYYLSNPSSRGIAEEIIEPILYSIQAQLLVLIPRVGEDVAWETIMMNNNLNMSLPELKRVYANFF